MEFNTNQLFFILPEIILLSGISIILILNLFLNKKSEILGYYLSQILLMITLISCFNLLGVDVKVFYNSFVVDNLAIFSKIFILIFSIILLTYSKEYFVKTNKYQNEYFSLALLSILGMMIMSSGSNLITLYLGLEIMSLGLYSMIAMAKDKIVAIEAALKYFILGAIASGILLYGMSLIYGGTGSLDMATIAQNLASANPLIINFASVFLIIGIAFKLGAVPFHMWVPDVYQGANLSTTMFLSSVPKIATALMFIRIMIEGLGVNSSYWSDIIMFLGVSSVIIGTVIALNQTNIKRLLAYSTISHIGFILVAFSFNTNLGSSSAIFYTIIYAFTTIAVFGSLIALSKSGLEIKKIIDLKGIGKTQPLYALLLLITMFSMAGIPPFIGFYAKLAVLNEVVNNGHLIIAITLVIFAVIGAYYYLSIVKIMYFDKADEIGKNKKLHNSFAINFVLILNTFALLLFGIIPDDIIAIIFTML